MLASLYPASMVWMVAMTILWFWFDERKRRSGATRIAALLGAGLLLYVPALIACEGGLMYKLAWILPRDVLTVLITVIVSGYIKRNRTFLATLAGFLLFASVFYWGMLERGVNFARGLDPNAELLIDVANPATDIADLQAAFPDLTFTPLLDAIARPDDTELDDYMTVDIPRSRLHGLNRFFDRLDASPLVDQVEFNEQVRLHQQKQPTKPPQPPQPPPKTGPFGFNDPRATDQWALGALNLKGYPEWVRKQTPKKQILLVMIDTGVNANHEDLAAHYHSIDPDSDTDARGHGTHCAGIAAAVSNNGKGIASLSGGTSWLRVASVRVFEDSGTTSQARVLAGMVKAADAGADVISMSLGGPSEEGRDLAYQRAVDYIVDNGAIVVVSAGNRRQSARFSSPANCERVIAVSAIAADGHRAPFSNTVDELKLGITAPGASVLSTFGAGYRELSGTSMSAPYVSGLVAMMKALQPELGPDEAWKILHRTGSETPEGNETGRLIQPLKALKAAK